MTENRAAYEAATLEAMHTGDYAALTAYARTIADVDDAPEPPDLEYTPITAPLPELVRPADVAALREEAARLRMINERLARENMTLSELAADRWRVIAELKGRLSIVPVGAIRRYFEHSDAFRDVRNGKYDIDQGRLDCLWIADWLDAQPEVQP